MRWLSTHNKGQHAASVSQIKTHSGTCMYTHTYTHTFNLAVPDVHCHTACKHTRMFAHIHTHTCLKSRPGRSKRGSRGPRVKTILTAPNFNSRPSEPVGKNVFRFVIASVVCLPSLQKSNIFTYSRHRFWQVRLGVRRPEQQRKRKIELNTFAICI